MQNRKKLIDLFSTFIHFSDDIFNTWITDFKLKKNIENYLKKEPEKQSSESFWSFFFYREYYKNSNVLAKNHLLAYLQEPCYWAAQNTVNKFPNLHYKLSDCFQMAISQYDQILKTYNIDYGTSLCNFAQLGFRTIINNIFRQKSAIDICTDWALLRKISKKRLRASLENAGLNQTQIDQYCLIFICFQNIYTPKQQKISQKLSTPDLDTWKKIISAYQQQIINYPQLKLKEENSQINAQSVEKILLQSAKCIRQYLYPQTTSLNTTITEDESKELLDLIATDNLPPLEQVISIEEVRDREKNYTKINYILTEALKQLKPELQKILNLYYIENFTQQDIAKTLDIQQYTISRKITKARELLLKALIQWSTDSLKITIDTNKIQEMSRILEEWMINYYSSQK